MEQAHKNVSSPVVYVVVFGCLIVLTGLTAWASTLHLGKAEVLVALAIAAAKAGLVTLFFMHLLHMGRLNWVIVLAGLFWLGIAGTLTMADYVTRSWYSVVASPQTAIDTLANVEQRLASEGAAAGGLADDEPSAEKSP
jgi:cytochrome c oxidase subunit 4